MAELSGQSRVDVITEIKSDPFGPVGGLYNIKTHLHQMHAVAGADMLWSTNTMEARPLSPPEYRARSELEASSSNRRFIPLSPPRASKSPMRRARSQVPTPPKPPELVANISKQTTDNESNNEWKHPNRPTDTKSGVMGNTLRNCVVRTANPAKAQTPEGGLAVVPLHPVSRKQISDSGDCTTNPRLPSIDEHSNTDLNEARRDPRWLATSTRKLNSQDARSLRSVVGSRNDGVEYKRSQFYRRAGDGISK